MNRFALRKQTFVAAVVQYGLFPVSWRFRQPLNSRR